MKKRAILYIRVSTDEQKAGHSLPYQEERLRKYCDINGIEVVALYQDDYSAKTFERPEWRKLLEYVKKSKGLIDYVLFINWSRFSRNAGDAYGMIKTLNKCGIEPQAVEQPLDLSIPEQKMMLAFYLAAPEVENDRRSLNVFMGMRKARKEGFWVGSAPKGFDNVRNELGKPTLVANKDAVYALQAFEDLNKGVYTQEEIRRKLNSKGFKCSKNNFNWFIRNPVYCGKIFIPAYKDEEAVTVPGIHQGIVSEELFYSVQDILNGKRKNIPKKNSRQRDELPLRGLLQCSKCGGNITGSASKGNGGKYFYYHCRGTCKERFKAEEAHLAVENLLKEIRVKSNTLTDMYLEIMKTIFKENEQDHRNAIRKKQEEIERQNERLKKTEELMLDEQLELAEYRSIKKRLEEVIGNLTREKINMELMDSNYMKYIQYDFALLKNVDGYYKKADLDTKRKLIGSVFTGKLIFEENQCRTTRLNEVVKLIALGNNDLPSNKKGQKTNNSFLSQEVIPLGFEPKTPSLKVMCSTS